MTTPMMQQWHQCKKKAKDALLFFRLGDFYEAFYKDAQIISKEINLTLTKRQGIPMCGIPHHTSETYINKLIKKGFKIAIAEQLENAQEVKRLVKRDIVRVITPGTIFSVGETQNNFFLCLYSKNKIGMSIIDLSTSEFYALEIDSLKELKDEIYKFKPSEILISEKSKYLSFLKEIDLNFIVTRKEDWFFEYQNCFERLSSHFQVYSLDGFGLKEKPEAIIASGVLLSHLQNDLCYTVEHIKSLSLLSLSEYMSLDSNCLSNLELLNFSTQKSHTLFDILDSTKTPMGSRLLKTWISHPLLNKNKIEERLNYVDELSKNTFILNKISEYLDNIRDLERLITKISNNYDNPKDLISLEFSLEMITPIKVLFQETIFVSKTKNLDELKEISLLIKNAIDGNATRTENFIKEGFDRELDELKSISRNSKEWLANYQNKLRLETGIKNLKVSFTRVFGYYIEVSKGQANKIPDYFMRRQTLVNSERFISEELKNFEHKILTSEERIRALESKLYNEIKLKVLEFTHQILQNSKILAQIDVLCSFAHVAIENNYIRPLINDGDAIEIKDGRHPVIESAISLNDFIPNDILLDKETTQLMLITGPNMAGKSTFIRQVALIVIMAQMGSFVPASYASIGIIDKIFCRIGANDDLTRGQSTFMVEMSETANILNNATSKSLVILDEIGRGTSTYDGISIAWAVAEHLLYLGSKTLFATHFWELTAMEKEHKLVTNYNISVKENFDKIIFLRKIQLGGTDKSYGIHVGRLAGLPQKVLNRAKNMLLNLEERFQKKPIQKEVYIPKPSPILEELKNLEIDKISPLEALQKLFEIKQNL